MGEESECASLEKFMITSHVGATIGQLLDPIVVVVGGE
jgi:hypothetical protein